MAGFSSLTRNAEEIATAAKKILVPTQKPEKTESFEQALARLNLTQADLKEKQKNFLRLAFTFAAVAGVILTYAVYLLFFGSFNAFMLAFIVSLIALSFAFRFHFWWFQVKKRKLGCSIKEWYESSAGEDNQ